MEHQIFRFAEMILRDRCSPSYDLASLSLVRGRQLCIQLSIFEGSLPELLSFGCGQNRNLKEVSQNCFVFDVANFENGGHLAKLLRF